MIWRMLYLTYLTVTIERLQYDGYNRMAINLKLQETSTVWSYNMTPTIAWPKQINIVTPEKYYSDI